MRAHVDVPNRVTLDDGVVTGAYPVEGTLHGQMRGAQDVQPLNLAGAGRANANPDRLGADQFGQTFALRPTQHFRVTHPRNLAAIDGHVQRAGDHGAAQRGNAALVDADDAREPLAPIRAFNAESWIDDDLPTLGAQLPCSAHLSESVG